jgi:hypothetical protein
MVKQNKVRLLSAITPIVFLFLFTDLYAHEEFQARLFSGSGAGFQRDEKIAITVDSYTSTEEVIQLIQTFHKSGYKKFRTALRKMKKGFLRPICGRGMQVTLHAAQSTPTKKGRHIILVGESQDWSMESHRRQDSRFPFLVIELDINEKGRGSGELYVAANIRLTGQGTIERSGYNTPPWQLIGLAQLK